MLVKLTSKDANSSFYIDAKNVRLIQEVKGNKLQHTEDEVVLISYFLTPQGLQWFSITETPEEAARLVNAALEEKNLLVS
jgi:hypothetical protein